VAVEAEMVEVEAATVEMVDGDREAAMAATAEDGEVTVEAVAVAVADKVGGDSSTLRIQK